MTKAEGRRRRLDQQLLVGLAGILFLYAIITLGTVSNVPSPTPTEGSATFFEQSSRRRGAQRSETTSEAIGISSLETLRNTFPVHVGDDVEEIDHPGLAFSDNRVNGKGLPAKMTVPRFWDSPEAYGPGGVREYLGHYGERLMTPREASHVGSFYKGLETIYVSVASYRDPECIPTLESLYLRAKHPERIRVAVIDQRAPGDPKCSQPEKPCEEDPSQVLCRYRHLMDFYDMDARFGVGPVFARHLGHRHYRGEFFAMQVDSHVRFVESWEDDLINQWKSAQNEMAVMTTYLSDLINSIDPVTHKGIHPGRPIMCATDYEGEGVLKHLRHGQQPEGPPQIHGQPTLHPFWAAGFSFARGHFVAQVPYDQYLPMVFQGEEISMGLRGFTYGYDYYTSERSVCFHMYAVKENKDKRKKVKLFWENANLYQGAGKKAMRRLNGIIGMDDKTYFDTEEKKYGLGKIRRKEQFFSTFGIHTDTQTVEKHLCQFVGKKMMDMWLPHLRKNGMGINYDEIDFKFVDPVEPKKPIPPAKKVPAEKITAKRAQAHRLTK